MSDISERQSTATREIAEQLVAVVLETSQSLDLPELAADACRLALADRNVQASLKTDLATMKLVFVQIVYCETAKAVTWIEEYAGDEFPEGGDQLRTARAMFVSQLADELAEVFTASDTGQGAVSPEQAFEALVAYLPRKDAALFLLGERIVQLLVDAPPAGDGSISNTRVAAACDSRYHSPPIPELPKLHAAHACGHESLNDRRVASLAQEVEATRTRLRARVNRDRALTCLHDMANATGLSLNPNLLMALLKWGPIADADETRAHLQKALQQQPSYHEFCTATLLLIARDVRDGIQGLDAGTIQPALLEALQRFDALLDEDAGRAFEYFNGPMYEVERDQVARALESIDAATGLVARALAKNERIAEALTYVTARLEVLQKLKRPPILHMLVEQARIWLGQAIEECKDSEDYEDSEDSEDSEGSPSDTESFRRAVQCAREGVKVASFYDDSPLAEGSRDWAKEFLERVGEDEQDAPAPEEPRASKGFVASARAALLRIARVIVRA